MSTFARRPGAWLSGTAWPQGVANTPIERPRAHTPIEGPGGSGQTPIEGPGGPRHTPIEAPSGARKAGPGVPMPTPAPLPLPWDHVDPDWAFGGADSLLALALRRSRSRVMARDADDLTEADLAQAMRSGRPLDGQSLWCWAPEFRLLAVQADLAGRFQVQGAAVRVLGRADAGRVASQPIFGIGRSRGFETYQRQIDRVLRAAAEREDRLPEILSQAHDTWPFFESITGLSLAERPRLAELLQAAHQVTTLVLMALKNNIGALRPVQCSTRVAPVIPTPGHGSLPSGHATLAALDAELLGLLVFHEDTAAHRNRRVQLDRLARRIAFNRVVAGLHFPIDSLVGHLLGRQLARVLAALAGAPTRWEGPVDDATLDRVDRDLDLPEAAGPAWPKGARALRLDTVASWAELWRRTAAEVRRRS